MAENSEGAKSLQRRCAIVLAMAAFVAGMGLYGVHMIHEGFSARDRPSRVEVLVARKARHWAIPSKANNLRNPMSATAELLEHGRNHWAAEQELFRERFRLRGLQRGPPTQNTRGAQGNPGVTRNILVSTRLEF